MISLYHLLFQLLLTFIIAPLPHEKCRDASPIPFGHLHRPQSHKWAFNTTSTTHLTNINHIFAFNKPIGYIIHQIQQQKPHKSLMTQCSKTKHHSAQNTSTTSLNTLFRNEPNDVLSRTAFENGQTVSKSRSVFHHFHKQKIHESHYHMNISHRNQQERR